MVQRDILFDARLSLQCVLLRCVHVKRCVFMRSRHEVAFHAFTSSVAFSCVHVMKLRFMRSRHALRFHAYRSALRSMRIVLRCVSHQGRFSVTYGQMRMHCRPNLLRLICRTCEFIRFVSRRRLCLRIVHMYLISSCLRIVHMYISLRISPCVRRLCLRIVHMYISLRISPCVCRLCLRIVHMYNSLRLIMRSRCFT
jgi:hypothetical protein